MFGNLNNCEIKVLFNIKYSQIFKFRKKKKKNKFWMKKRKGVGEFGSNLQLQNCNHERQAQAPKRRHKMVDGTWLFPHSHVCLHWTCNFNSLTNYSSIALLMCFFFFLFGICKKTLFLSSNFKTNPWNFWMDDELGLEDVTRCKGGV